MKSILGIHHVTAICSDAQQNLEFYSGLLGLRLVKRTVNFDDPGTYHLYYGDGVGHPGTILTFFAWPGAGRGRAGNGQVTVTSFAIPAGSISYWSERLRNSDIAFRGPELRFGEEVLEFEDPDGMLIELIASKTAASDRAYAAGPVPIEHAIQGFHSATLSEGIGYQKTAQLLTDTFGWQLIEQDGTRFRFALNSSEPGSVVDIVHVPELAQGRVAAGSVHHIAWRTADDEAQGEWLRSLNSMGFGVSPVMDRVYFHSIYFREPGGILFEIATDSPGFTVDEPERELGQKLALPAWLERTRGQIERSLPPLELLARV
jgi:catechol 2,3-dioxygenase-like lactoylglutathione lyase family enzyme